MKIDTDVLVVGAGPVGLMLACELQRRGVRHRLVDARASREYYCKALGVTPRTLEVFDQMGLLDEAVSRGLWTRAVNTTVNGERVARVEVNQNDDPYGQIVLAQYDTEEVLDAFLREHGGSIERGRTVIEVTQEDTGVRCRFDDGEVVTARFVAGCDGAHSVVRKQAGIAYEGDRYEPVFVLGDVDMRWPHPHDEVWKMVQMTNGEMTNMLVVVPIPGDPQRYRISLAAPPQYWDPAVALPDPISLDFLTSIANEILPPETTITRLRWSSMYRISHRLADRYRAGRLFVVGDAAHIHPPIGGLGMNTGLQDAFNLGWKLARVLRGESADALLDTYHEERHRAGQEVVALTSRRMDDAVGGGQTDSEREAAEERANTQLDVNYRGGTLTGGAVPAGDVGPVPGERMAYIDGLRRPHVQRVTRFIELLRPGRFVLLGYGAPDPSIYDTALEALGEDVRVWQVAAADSQDRPTLLDPEGAVPRALGAGPGAVLVRPDGYVAWRGQDAADLRGFLSIVRG